MQLQQDNHNCEICEKNFFTRLDLNVHIKHFHNTLPSSKRSRFEETFLVDLQKHRNDVQNAKLEVFSCDVCEKTFTDISILRNHFMRVHDSTKKQVDMINANKENPMKCLICGKIFFHPYLLRDHVKDKHESSNIKKKYGCGSCDKVYSFILSLQRHRRHAHILKVDFKCQSCD